MALRVSTTSSDVSLPDLGITLVHPTTNRDLSLEFTSVELRDSEDLTDAIQNGDLSADDGVHFIHEDDYDPDELLIQELNIDRDELYISRDELLSRGDILIQSEVFPLSLNSTAASTKNIYAAGGRFKTWHLEPGDIIIIAGNVAAGTYTVDTVTDQQNFIVNESITDSTGGTVTIYHPVGATRMGVNDSPFSVISGDTVQQVLESIDSNILGGGISESQHLALNVLAHNLDESHEIVPTLNADGIMTTITSREPSGGDTIRESKSLITNGDGLVTGYTITQHDDDGNIIETVTSTVTISGGVPTVATLTRTT